MVVKHHKLSSITPKEVPVEKEQLKEIELKNEKVEEPKKVNKPIVKNHPVFPLEEN